MRMACTKWRSRFLLISRIACPDRGFRRRCFILRYLSRSNGACPNMTPLFQIDEDGFPFLSVSMTDSKVSVATSNRRSQSLRTFKLSYPTFIPYWRIPQAPTLVPGWTRKLQICISAEIKRNSNEQSGAMLREAWSRVRRFAMDERFLTYTTGDSWRTLSFAYTSCKIIHFHILFYWFSILLSHILLVALSMYSLMMLMVWYNDSGFSLHCHHSLRFCIQDVEYLYIMTVQKIVHAAWLSISLIGEKSNLVTQIKSGLIPEKPIGSIRWSSLTEEEEQGKEGTWEACLACLARIGEFYPCELSDVRFWAWTFATRSWSDTGKAAMSARQTEKNKKVS